MIFISLEGIDGSGKTTIAKLLKDNLSQRGYNVLLTREPGGDPVGEKIRDIILDKENKTMSAWTEALLYISARKQHLEKVIVPAIRSGIIVICDRFSDSTLAYQGYARGLGVSDVEEIQNIVFGPIKPDLTIFFDITPKEAAKRIATRKDEEKDRIENEDKDFHEKVYEGYKKVINENTDRIKVVDARKNIQTISSQTLYMIEELLEEKEKNIN